jgi:hypothetical protein|tara:strand:- start:1572 stop:1694 length:123 start_codon:yes stop_codon:yes gene_type:complete
MDHLNSSDQFDASQRFVGMGETMMTCSVRSENPSGYFTQT